MKLDFDKEDIKILNLITKFINLTKIDFNLLESPEIKKT